jgi:hypothetical protein
MSKYRISASVDGKNFFLEVVDKERFVRNPTTENIIRRNQLKKDI